MKVYVSGINPQRPFIGFQIVNEVTGQTMLSDEAPMSFTGITTLDQVVAEIVLEITRFASDRGITVVAGDFLMTYPNMLTPAQATVARYAPNIYMDGVLVPNANEMVGSATVLNGQVVLPLTDGNGNAICPTNVFPKSGRYWIDSNTAQYQFGSPVVSDDKKTLTMTVTKVALNLGLIAFTSSANGIVVNFRIYGQP